MQYMQYFKRTKPEVDVEINSSSTESQDEGDNKYSASASRGLGNTLALAFSSLGAIYGDIGTSPLYVLNSIKFADTVATRDDVYGCVSLIFWLFVLLVSFKYAWIVLTWGPNDGEGGQVAIYAKITRYIGYGPKGVTIPGGPQIGDIQLMKRTETLSSVQQDGPATSWRRNPAVLKALSYIIMALCFLGCALIISDGLLTPTTSVLSAIGGIQVAKPDLSNHVVTGVSEVILLFLFAIQQVGSFKLSFAFAPIMFLWFIGLSICGIYNIVRYDHTVFKALSPYYAIQIMRGSNIDSLGGAMLAITGTEAMFADLGHFGPHATQIGIGFTMICLMLNYLGQGAYLTKYPENIASAFYLSIPGGTGSWFYWIMFVLAILACVIASQALILGVFSILSQLINLDCFPKLKIIRTSPSYRGKVYIPLANFLLMIGVVCATAGFQISNNVTAAYGFGISMDFATTSALLILCMIFVYDAPLWIPLLFGAIFLPLEFCLIIANAKKVPQGAWFPLMMCVIFLLALILWRYCREKTVREEYKSRVKLIELFPESKGLTQPRSYTIGEKSNVSKGDDDIETNEVDAYHDDDDDGGDISNNSMTRYSTINSRYGLQDLKTVPGIAIIYSDTPERDIASPNSVPNVYAKIVQNFTAIPSVVIFCTIRSTSTPYANDDDRILISAFKVPGHYRCMLRFGFMEHGKVTLELQKDILSLIPEAQTLLCAQSDIKILHIFEKTSIRSRPLKQDGNCAKRVFSYISWSMRKFAIERIFSPVNSVFQNPDDTVITNPADESADKLFIGGVLRI